MVPQSKTFGSICASLEMINGLDEISSSVMVAASFYIYCTLFAQIVPIHIPSSEKAIQIKYIRSESNRNIQKLATSYK